MSGAGDLAVVVEAPAGPGNRDLAFWREGLRHALRRAGLRVLVLRPLLAEAAPAQAEGVLAVAAPEPRALSVAVDAVLRRLAPRVVHGPERGGALLAALAARAGGMAHAHAAFVLHARGPARFREEERGRFPANAAALLLEAQERAAARLAPRFVAACPAVAGWLAEQGGWPAPEPVAPLPPPLPARAGTGEGGWELVVPGPLDGAEGLEFLCAALRRAGLHGAAWPVAFLGEPGETAVSEPARVIAALGAAVAWRAPEAAEPAAILAYFAASPRRAMLLGARRAAPPELLAACAAMGVPVVARRNAALEAWARAHPDHAVDLLPDGERPFAAALARWVRPSVEGGPKAPPAAPPDWLVPTADAPAEPAAADSPGRFLFHPGRAPLDAERRGAVDAALRRAARLSGAALVTAARAPGALPLGAEPDTVLLDPDATLGEALLLDTEADPEGRVAAALGTRDLPLIVAEAGLRTLGLPDCWHAPLPPPAEQASPARRFAAGSRALPPPLRDAARLLLPPPSPRTRRFPDPEAERLAAALDAVPWAGAAERLSRLAALLDALGLAAAAADARAGVGELGAAAAPPRGAPPLIAIRAPRP